MAHRPSQRRPLANVLAELAYLKPDLVLVRGQHTFRIEHVSALARRETKSGSESLRKYLSAFDFWWEEDPDGKIVVMTQTPEGPRPLAAEYGSKSIAWTLENERIGAGRWCCRDPWEGWIAAMESSSRDAVTRLETRTPS